MFNIHVHVQYIYFSVSRLRPQIQYTYLSKQETPNLEYDCPQTGDSKNTI